MGVGFSRGDSILFFVIKAEPKTITKCRKCSLGGVGFRSLDRALMSIAPICGTCRTPTSAFPNDNLLAGSHTDSDTGHISTINPVIAASLIQTLEMRRFPVPTVKTEYRIGFRNGEPAFDI